MNPALTIVGNTRIALAFSESSLAAGSLAQSFFSAALASSSTPAAAAASAARGAVRLIVEIATATIATRPRVHFLMSSLLVRSVILPLPSRNLLWPDEAPIVSFLPRFGCSDGLPHVRKGSELLRLQVLVRRQVRRALVREDRHPLILAASWVSGPT